MSTAKIKLREIITLAVFFIVIGSFTMLNFVITPPEFIDSERRRPAQSPNFTLNTLFSGEFMVGNDHNVGGFDSYVTDNFVFREQLRSVRAMTMFHIFRQASKDGLFFTREAGIGSLEQLDEAQYRRSAAQIGSLFELMDGLNLYFSVIPGKSFYTPHHQLELDPIRGMAIIQEELPDVEMIDITAALTIGDFYYTDLHWDQTRLWDVVAALSQAMDFPMPQQTDIQTVGEWRGAYYGQLALPMRPDIMRIHDIPGVTAYYWTPQGIQQGPVHDERGFHSVDPFNIFLRGPQPLIWLETGHQTGRNLYVFRDSFGSSIAPLLALSEGYDQVVLIDLRLIHGRVLDDVFTFTPESDVLFLYSTQILNNSVLFQGR
ncbi:MAG: hypothetical protein FWE06_04025 [Oscillospiraceae bacterium]|nr:hypothetical protein [Oscillospiraceae bacterium]